MKRKIKLQRRVTAEQQRHLASVPSEVVSVVIEALEVLAKASADCHVQLLFVGRALSRHASLEAVRKQYQAGTDDGLDTNRRWSFTRALVFLVWNRELAASGKALWTAVGTDLISRCKTNEGWRCLAVTMALKGLKLKDTAWD